MRSGGKYNRHDLASFAPDEERPLHFGPELARALQGPPVQVVTDYAGKLAGATSTPAVLIKC